MKAMILAAGLGTRLRPLTDSIPKALIEINGIPMLERIITKLKGEGFTRIVVNLHHHADKIRSFLKNRNYGIDLSLSDESDQLLDTGGGIAKAFPLLFNDYETPVLIHNVDIISNADLSGLMSLSHRKGEGVLLVSKRESSRKLIFNEQMELKGWHDLNNRLYKPDNIELKELTEEYAFSGIYTLTRKQAEEMICLKGKGKYSVMDYFINNERKEKIRGFIQENLQLIDIGKPATLQQASEILNNSDNIFGIN